MKDVPFEPVATTFVLRGQRHTHIDPTSYCPADLAEYNLDMTGSVEVRIRGTTCRVPAIKHPCGSIETAEIVIAITSNAPPARGCLILPVGEPEEVVVWTAVHEAPIDAKRVWLAFSDDDAVVRVLAPWEVNQSVPVYFLLKYGMLSPDHLPPGWDVGDTIASIMHEHGPEVLDRLRAEPDEVLGL